MCVCVSGRVDPLTEREETERKQIERKTADAEERMERQTAKSI